MGMLMNKETSIIWTISKEDLLLVVADCKGYSEILRKLGLSSRGSSNFRRLKKRLEQDNIVINKFDKSILLATIRNKISNDRLLGFLASDKVYSGPTHRLKLRLIKNGYLENKCYICGLKDWLGNHISLHLDHIDGNNKNNKIDNLRILCPNCHSQTETYGGKNKRRYNAPIA